MSAISKSCRDYMDKYSDSRVNCANCVKFNREHGVCSDIAGVMQRYEDSPVFDTFSRMMTDNRPVYLG